MYIRWLKNKQKDIPIHQIKLLSKIISDTVDVGVVDELPMRGINLFLENNLAGNKVQRPYQNNQKIRGKGKFRPKNENKKMNAVTGTVTRVKAKEREKENSGKRNNEKQENDMRKNSINKKDLIRN